MINWWFNDEFKNPTISGYELHQIPIKRNNQIEKEISSLVAEILIDNKLGKDIESFTKQIDKLIFELYDLTEEEIEIIENSIK